MIPLTPEDCDAVMTRQLKALMREEHAPQEVNLMKPYSLTFAMDVKSAAQALHDRALVLAATPGHDEYFAASSSNHFDGAMTRMADLVDQWRADRARMQGKAA